MPYRDTACGYSDRYLGLTYPTCNKGKPCAACLAKYKEKQARLASQGKRTRR